MITFTRAPTVAAGDRITSTQWNRLAAAFNDRLRSGLADGPWRIVFYWLSMFRQVRNPDESGFLFPGLAEFFTAGYQMIEPGEGTWPVGWPGEPEGANVVSQLMAYVFGAEALNLDDEATRLNTLPLGLPGSDLEYWQQAKLQRGAWDPDTGGLGSPAWSAAREHYKIAYSTRSPHGHAYGSWFATPAVPGVCDDPNDTDDFPPPINYEIKFSPTAAGLAKGYGVQIYEGTCQPVPGGNEYPSHVRWISYTPWAYYVWKNDGSLDVLLTSDFVEGPYEGQAALRKTANNAIPRVLNTFVREFRGSEDQRAESTYHLQEAFDTHRFLTRQYHLSPNRGVESGGHVTEVYPLYRFSGAVELPAGTLATHTQSGATQYEYGAGFVFTGALLTATKLSEPADVELVSGNAPNQTVLATVTLTPDESGNATVLRLVSDVLRPVPLRCRLAGIARFMDGSGKIEVECTELVERKPAIEDLYLTLRLGGAISSEVVDGRGIEETRAREIGENYFNYGCLTNLRGLTELTPPVSAVNNNAVWDAARRLSQCVRIIPRQNLRGYAVENGKSVVWFKRDAAISGAGIDLFGGIAPARAAVASGDILPERVYVVRSGGVTYHGASKSAGQTFTGVAGDTTYTGAGEVYEYDGIRHTAEPAGETNEWLMGVQLKGYNPNEESIWKPDAYSDYWPLVNRCHFYSPEIANDRPLLWHTSYGQRVGTHGVVAPESPSGWNYAILETAWLGRTNVNKIECGEEDLVCQEQRRNFYRSCRVYEPDPEIESATIEIQGGEEWVKLTFAGRFHHAVSAPASINRDMGTWDKAALRTEAGTIRTVENALREYLVQQADGTNATAAGPGNNAANSAVQTLPDAPYGSVYPTFYFVKLVPSGREDSNDTQDATDTHFTHDAFTLMEVYLRAMCEGYVDGRTSAEYACLHNTSSLFDYTFQNLCFEAFDNRWISTLPLDVRTDNPEGFGPLPNTEALAAVFNQFSAAVNLLTRVRVMLPMKLQVAYDASEAVEYVTAFNPDETPNVACNTTGPPMGIYWDGVPPDPPAPGFTAPAWSDYSVPIQTNVQASLDGTCDGAGHWAVRATRQSARIRWEPTDPDAVLAIPESWRDMFEENSVLLARVLRVTTSMSKQLVGFDDAQRCGPTGSPPEPALWFRNPDYWKFPTTRAEAPETCELLPGQSSLAATAIEEAQTLARGVTAGLFECELGPVNEAAAVPIADAAAMIEVELV